MNVVWVIFMQAKKIHTFWSNLAKLLFLRYLSSHSFEPDTLMISILVSFCREFNSLQNALLAKSEFEILGPLQTFY